MVRGFCVFGARICLICFSSWANLTHNKGAAMFATWEAAHEWATEANELDDVGGYRVAKWNGQAFCFRNGSLAVYG